MPAPAAPIDPSVKLPPAVAAAAARANELMSGTAIPTPVEPAPTPPQVQETPPQPVETPPAQPVQAQEASPQPPQGREPPEEGPGDSWKSRFRP
jgi:hypothetical protein